MQTNAFITGMAQGVDAVKNWTGKGVPAGTGATFNTFVRAWANFYASDFSSRPRVLAHWLTSNLQAQLINFQQQAADWGKKLKKWGVKFEATSTEGAPNKALGVLTWIGIGVVVLGGLYLIGKAVHKATLGGAALEEAEQEAMQIAEEKKRKKRDKTALTIS